MSKGNLPTSSTGPTLILAGTQAAADNPLEAALGQATKKEAKLPAPGLAIESVCTRPDAAMNPMKSHIPTANTPVRTDAGNGKLMSLELLLLAPRCSYRSREGQGGVCFRHQHARLQNAG